MFVCLFIEKLSLVICRLSDRMVSQAVIGQLKLSILITVFIYQLINYDMGGALVPIYNVRIIRKGHIRPSGSYNKLIEFNLLFIIYR